MYMFTLDIFQQRYKCVNNNVKNDFQKQYPNWNITTLDYYPDLIEKSSVDIIQDICSDKFEMETKFDLIITPTEKKMRQNTVMIYIFYNYVSSNLLNVPLLFLLL